MWFHDCLLGEDKARHFKGQNCLGAILSIDTVVEYVGESHKYLETGDKYAC